MNRTNARPDVSFRMLDDLPRRGGRERRLPRVRHAPRQVEDRLARVVELGVELELRRPADAEPALDVVERAVDGQRRRRQHRRVHPVEQQVADDRRDVDRRRSEEDAAAARLEEVHVAGVVGTEQEPQIVLDLGCAAAERQHVFRHVLRQRDVRFERLERRAERRAVVADAARGRDRFTRMRVSAPRAAGPSKRSICSAEKNRRAVVADAAASSA